LEDIISDNTDGDNNTKNMDITVAIDGLSGSGKSTIAREVAKRLGKEALDTGAMYRAVTLLAIENRLDPGDENSVYGIAATMELESNDNGRWFLNGRDVTDPLRSAKVDEAVSVVASHGKVREELVARQREWVLKHRGGVVEGRDIASVVLPSADLKIYLTASDAIRSTRRVEQISSKKAEENSSPGPSHENLAKNTVSENTIFPEANCVEERSAYIGSNDNGQPDIQSELEEQTRLIVSRDLIDQSRKHSPLVIAEDAIVIDTGTKTIEEIVDYIISQLYSK